MRKLTLFSVSTLILQAVPALADIGIGITPTGRAIPVVSFDTSNSGDGFGGLLAILALFGIWLYLADQGNKKEQAELAKRQNDNQL